MKHLLLVCAMLIFNYLQAQPYLDSFDINQSFFYKDSRPGNFYADGNILYFTADDSIHGNELWVFFENTSAPQRITDINGGPKASMNMYGEGSITTLNGGIYFAANDSIHGIELWYYHGNTGLKRLTDLKPGTGHSSPQSIISYNNKVYFYASDSSVAGALWELDPNKNNTIRNLSDTDKSKRVLSPKQPIVFNNKILFTGITVDHGWELHAYDPATDSISLVEDIRSGKVGSGPGNYVITGNKLYFTANDGFNGIELFEYDGNKPPVRLTDLYSGTGAGIDYSSELEVFNNAIYFYGYDAGSSTYQLFKYDPATNMPSLVYKVNPSASANIAHMAVYNGSLYFSADDGSRGVELWKYTGTGNPKRVTDIAPFSKSSVITNLTATGLGLYFSAKGDSIGTELFRYSDYPLAINNVNFKGSVKLYPNPAKNNAYLELELNQAQYLDIRITDINGRLAYSTGAKQYNASTHTVLIPTSKLLTGNYTYSVYANSGRLLSTGILVKE